MFIKNNSKREWKQYNIGRGIFVDIKPGAIIEIADEAGRKLLSLLGAPNWLTVCEEPKLVPEKDVSVEDTKEEKIVDAATEGLDVPEPVEEAPKKEVVALKKKKKITKKKTKK